MQLKVLTFNMLFAGAVNPAGAWHERLPLVVDVLRQTEADVVAFQEATAGQLADIARALPEFAQVSGPESGETRLPRVFQTVGRLLRRNRGGSGGGAASGGAVRGHAPTVAAARAAEAAAAAPLAAAAHHRHPAHPVRGEHCAILYRADRFAVDEGAAFWLSHRPDDPGSVLFGSWLPRVVNWVRLRERGAESCAAPGAGTGTAGTGCFTVYNAHLDFLPWSPARSSRILRRMLDAEWDGSPQILMGDFNAAPRSAAYTHLGLELKRGDAAHPPLADAWTVAAERAGPEGTFHGGTGRVRWIGRLDRILFRPALTVERVTTVTHHDGSRYPSDHYPVLAELRIV